MRGLLRTTTHGADPSSRSNARLYGTTAILAATAMIAAACTSPNQGATAGPRSLTIAINAEPTSLDPQAQDDTNLTIVDHNIYDRLLDRTAAGTLVPDLAVAQPTLLNPTTWQFKLRSGPKFTDGEPVNADAVVFSIKRIISPALNSQLASTVAGISGAVKVNDQTVNITTSGPDPVLPAQTYFIAIMPPKATTTTNIGQKPIGSGPYMLKSWSHGNQIVLERNPKYWGKEPSITQATFEFPEDPATRLSGLVSGQFDLTTSLSPDDVNRAPKVATNQGSSLEMVEFNSLPTAGLTADPRVRQALNYAIDTKKIAATIFSGYATPNDCQILSPSWAGYDKSLPAYFYDPAKAKALLTAAGAIGKTITIDGSSGRFLKDRDFVLAIAQYWTAVGLKVRTNFLSTPQYLSTIYNKKAPADAIIINHDNRLFDAYRTLTYFYAQSGSIAYNANSQVAALVGKANQTTNTGERMSMYGQALQIGCQDAFFYFGLHIKDIYGMQKNVVWTPREDGLIYVKDISLR